MGVKKAREKRKKRKINKTQQKGHKRKEIELRRRGKLYYSVYWGSEKGSWEYEPSYTTNGKYWVCKE